MEERCRGISKRVCISKEAIETGFLAGDQLSKDKAEGQMEEDPGPLKVQHKRQREPLPTMTLSYSILPSDFL